MKPLARKSLASVLAAALFAGTLPRAAFANPPADEHNDEIRAAGGLGTGIKARGVASRGPAAAAAPVNPAAALKDLQAWGVYKGDDDVLRTYLGDGKTLTPLGQSLYRSLVGSHDPRIDKAALLDEVVGMQPALDRLRQNGPYDAKRQDAVARTLSMFEKKFGPVDA